MDQSLYDFLTQEGYFNIRQVPGIGYCGLHRMIFTVGVIYNLNWFGYEGRYCYPDLRTASDGLAEWSGQLDPPGPWIKHKGARGEYSNPELAVETSKATAKTA